MTNLEKYLFQLRRIEQHRGATAEKEIRKIYKGLRKELQSYLSDVYMNYSEEDLLNYGMLAKAGMDARFLEEVEQRINDITPKVASEIRKTVAATYEACYEGMQFAVEELVKDRKQLLDTFSVVRAVTPDVIKAAVNNPISGLTLNDTLEKHRKDIIYDIKRNIGVGLTNGDRYTTMAKRISESLDGDYKKSIRIVRTETHRVRESGFNDAATELNNALKNGTSGYVMAKTWHTMQDNRVRPARQKRAKYNHIKMDGVTIPIDDLFELPSGATCKAPSQTGVAGEDINCRCYLSYDLVLASELTKVQDGKKTIEEAAKVEKEEASAIRKELEETKITYNEVKPLPTALSGDEIVNRLAGGDKTSGSCSSLGLAYIGNKNGLDVLDFRGGDSRFFFSQKSNIKKMMELPNVKGEILKAKKEAADTAKIIRGLPKDKEYYLAVGKHASIIRNTDHGAEYLELQSPYDSGWKSFVTANRSMVDTLRQRFGCRKTVNKIKIGSQSITFEKDVVLIDVDSLADNEEFRKVLGYINTAVDDQKKGVAGNVK